MNIREESIKQRFAGAAQLLSVKPTQIVSLKVRDNVTYDEDYQQLIDGLCRETDVRCSGVQGDLQGRGHLLSFNKANVILVEHETGLELLYIAGSVASLVQLIPLVLQGWSALRGRFRGRGLGIDGAIEIRRIDEGGQLREDHLQGQHYLGVTAMGGGFAPALATAAEILHNEVGRVFVEVQTLSARLDALEKQVNAKQKPKRKNSAKANVKRVKRRSAEK